MKTNPSAFFAAAASLALIAPAMGQEESRADLLERFEQLRSGRSDAEMLERLFQERPGDIALPEDAEIKPSPWIIGVLVEPVDPFIREHLSIPDGAGVKVTRVMAGTPAANAGIRENDILVSANNQRVGTLDALKEAVVKAGEAEESLRLNLIRKGETMEITIEPARRRPEGPGVKLPDMDQRMDRVEWRLDRQQREIERLREQVKKLSGMIRRERRGMDSAPRDQE